MTDKEKARAYDEALKVTKNLIGAGLVYEDAAVQIFPELKESEDERISKEIIKYLEQNVPHHHRDEVLKSKEWIAWIEKQNSNVDNANKEYWRGYREGKQEILDKYDGFEKQGEQKPAIIIPKFRVGDNIKTTKEAPLTITKIDDEGYWSEDLFICGFDDADKWGNIARICLE